MSEEAPAPRVLDGSVWEEFCETLKSAGTAILGEASPDDPLDRAEGFRYLSRLTRLALEKYVESNDPLAPRFYRLSHETAKIGCDNPDSYYQNATISGQHEYRIRGTRGSVSYLGFGTYYGDYGKSGRSGCSGYLEGDELDVAADGSFEILLSCEKQPGNWLSMEPDSSMLIVRQNFLDKENEEIAQLEIERLGAAGPPAALTSQHLERGLDAAAAYVFGTASLFARWTEGFERFPNELRPLDESVKQGAHGDPNIFFYMGYWTLDPEEALLIEVRPPVCEYWNFQLNNYWMESLDYRYHSIDYNKHTAAYGEDGTLRMVVAPRNPEIDGLNWVDTAGHRHGTMGLRWVKAEDHPKPIAQVVRLADLRA